MVDILIKYGHKYKKGEGRFFTLDAYKALSSPVRLNILLLLSKNAEGLSAEEIADHLGENLFTIYYHLRILERYGMVNYKIRGSERLEEKVYYVDYSLIIFPLSNQWSYVSVFEREENKKAIIVVGSPDAHGKFNLRARDGYLAGHISNILGKRGWDVDIIMDTEFDENDVDHDVIVVLGGPLTNTISYKFNSHLRVFFDEHKHYRILKSTKSGVEYNEENVALVCKINHSGRWYIIISGTTIYATEGGICAFEKLCDVLLEEKKEMYYVVEGKDTNSDGKVDSIDIIEQFE